MAATIDEETPSPRCSPAPTEILPCSAHNPCTSTCTRALVTAFNSKQKEKFRSGIQMPNSSMLLRLPPACSSCSLPVPQVRSLCSAARSTTAPQTHNPLPWAGVTLGGDAHVLAVQAYGSQCKQLAHRLKNKFSDAIPCPAFPP